MSATAESITEPVSTVVASEVDPASTTAVSPDAASSEGVSINVASTTSPLSDRATSTSLVVPTSAARKGSPPQPATSTSHPHCPTVFFIGFFTGFLPRRIPHNTASAITWCFRRGSSRHPPNQARRASVLRRCIDAQEDGLSGG